MIKPDKSIALIDRGLFFSGYKFVKSTAQRDKIIKERTEMLLLTATGGRGKRLKALQH